MPRPQRRRGLRRAVSIAAALAGAAPAAAPDMTPALVALARQDKRVATVAFRLLTAGVPLCADQVPASGLVLHDIRQYPAEARAAAARAFGFAGQPAVLAVAPGSPAFRSGVLENDAILSIDGVAVAPTSEGGAQSYAATEEVYARLAAALSRGAVSLGIGRGGAARTARLEPAMACDSPVQLDPGRKIAAWSDGRGVALTTAMAEATINDDELAALIGHEIAHNILGHRARLDRQGVGSGLLSRVGAKARKVRDTEVEADRWGLYLAARAGYDPAAAAPFWRRVGRRHGGGIFADGTHPDWRDREAAFGRIAGEIARKRDLGEPLVPDAAVEQP